MPCLLRKSFDYDVGNLENQSGIPEFRRQIQQRAVVLEVLGRYSDSATYDRLHELRRKTNLEKQLLLYFGYTSNWPKE